MHYNDIFTYRDEASKARKDAELNFGYHKNHGAQYESLRINAIGA